MLQRSGVKSVGRGFAPVIRYCVPAVANARHGHDQTFCWSLLMPLRHRFGSLLSVALLVTTLTAASCTDNSSTNKDTSGDADEADALEDGEDVEEVA